MAEPFLSEIRMMSFNFAPKGWAQCNGQLLPINQNQALFSLLGTTFGGDGRVNFALPDLRGRVPIHVGSGHTLGERGGEQAHTHSIAELLERLIAVNLLAPILLTRQLAPRRVVFVSSIAGVVGPRGEAVYAATKAFAISFTDALHIELRGTGVRAMSVNPGPVPTEWQEVAGYEADRPSPAPGEISAEQVVRESLEAFDRGKRFLIPKQMENHGLKASNIDITDEAMTELVQALASQAEDHLGVARPSRAHLLVGGVGGVAAGVADRGREHAVELPEDALGTPEAPHGHDQLGSPFGEGRLDRCAQHEVPLGHHEGGCVTARERLVRTGHPQLVP